MNNANRVLPNLEGLNPTELKALILSQHELIVSRDSEIEQLKLLIAKLRRMQFGRSSEKLDRQIEQLELRLEALQVNDAQTVAAMPEQIASVEPVSRSARGPLPAHLPREVRTYLPKQKACPDCGGELHKLGEDVSEVLERIPSRFEVIRQVRIKLACACCERIVQAAAPSRPIERCVAGPGLLAHVLVSKYGDHLPLYRQSEIYAREGVELDRSTLADWVGGTSRLLEPLVEALRRHVMSAQKLHADDTPVPVLRQVRGRRKPDGCGRM
jgi:transposase